MLKRFAVPAIVVAIGIIIGTVFLIRSCLSRYDERTALGAGSGGGEQSASQFLVFEKEGKGVILSLVRYDRTLSYSRKGGIVQRSISSTYYVQANDLVTAAKKGSQEIKHNGKVKTYPVEIIGAAGSWAWLFAGELMAYDPFTLNKVADVAILEEKNPALKGKFINEKKYYSYDKNSQQITITLSDGSKYSLNTSTLVATPVNEDSEVPDAEAIKMDELEQQIKNIREARTAAYDRFRENNKLYQEKKIPLSQYKDSSTALDKETTMLGKMLDSLTALKNELKETKERKDEANRDKQNLLNINFGFSGIKANCDTFKGRWYGLFTTDELQKISQRFDYRSVNDDAARNKFYSADISFNNNYWLIAAEKTKKGDSVYLQGGFLLSRETGLPFHLTAPDGFLIVYKNKIGNDGLIHLARINIDGKQLWSVNTGLKEFADWQRSGTSLVITGTDNKELSSGGVNLLQVINLQYGSVAAYDYFTDKQRN